MIEQRGKASVFVSEDDETLPTKTEGAPQQETRAVFGSGDGDVDFRTMEWPAAAFLIAKAQFGIGVLSIPSTFHTLGLVPGIISLLILGAITTYGGCLTTELRLRYPHVHSVGDLGYMFFGPIGGFLFGWLYWILLVLTCGAAVLTTTVSLNALSDHAICTMAFAGIVVAVGLAGAFIRQLHKVAFLSYFGFTAVWLSIWILTIAVLVQDRPAAAPLDAPLDKQIKAFGNASFSESLSAVTSQLFALLGNVTFYSMSAEMKKPRDFTKAVLAGQGFVCLNYLLVGCMVYGRLGVYVASPALGSAGPVLKKVCYGFALPGVMVSVIIYGHLASKHLFVNFLRNSRHLDHSTPQHWMAWSGIYIFVVGIGFLAATGIPGFNNLVGLIGALTAGILCISVTGLTAILLMARHNAHDDENSDDEHHSKLRGPKGGIRSWMRFKTATDGSTKSMIIYIVSLFVIAAGIFLFVAGTYASIDVLVAAYRSGSSGDPFSCADNSV